VPFTVVWTVASGYMLIVWVASQFSRQRNDFRLRADRKVQHRLKPIIMTAFSLRVRHEIFRDLCFR